MGRETKNTLIAASRKLARKLDELSFSGNVRFVYNPLVYARAPFERYIERYADQKKRAVFLGMNPGPWGMAQTGIPFGAIEMVRGWLGIEGDVSSPPHEHPRLHVLGFACGRNEVSGTRLWGLMRDRYATADSFFRNNFVMNYCPLMFLDASGRNITPDKLAKKDRERLFKICDEHLFKALEWFKPQWAIGVGKFAASCLQRGAETGAFSMRIVSIPHPSPANPRANRNWALTVTRILEECGCWRAS
jgi:single-strand selective monofunctional uracil DNA glycosylase